MNRFLSFGTTMNRSRPARLLPFACLCLVVVALLPLCATGQQQSAYNRIQYHKYTWKTLHTEVFRVYFPRGYDSLASFASVQLPDILKEVKKQMGVGIKDMPNLVIYPSVDQLYESNIGLHETTLQTFPTINLRGSRVLVAFDGSYEHFREQLKEACVRLCWEEQFQNNVEEQLTNKKQLMPAWFRQGAIRYFARGWSIADEAEMEQMMKPRYGNLHEEPKPVPIYPNETLNGQAFCYFLAQQYGEEVPRQILFQLRSGKTLSKAVRLATKRRLDTLQRQCFAFYQARHPKPSYDEGRNDTLKTFLETTYKGKPERILWNSDSSAVFFVIAAGNYRDLFLSIRNDLLNAPKKIKPFTRYHMPPWLENDDSDPYPVVRWQPDGQGLYLLLPEKGKIRLMQYDSKGNYRDSRTLYGLDGAGTLDIAGRNSFLLSGYRMGRSDIVLYDAQRLQYTPLTSGQADHTQVSLLPGHLLAYRSGYPADSLYHKDTLARTYGIYYKELGGAGAAVKTRDKAFLLDSAFITWQDPELLQDGEIAITGTHTGRLLRDTLALKPGVHLPSPATMQSPWLKDYILMQKRKDSIAALLQAIKDKDEPSILRGILTPGNPAAAAAMQEDSLRRAMAYTGKKVRPYLLQLYSAYFSAQINNDYYINRFQPFQAYLGSFKFPAVGAMAQGGFSDLFENHHFNIGYRMPAGTEGSDFFVRYANTARKLDWHALFFRKVESLQPDPGRDWKDNRGFPYPQQAKVKTHYYELGFHYPLNYYWSLDFTTAARRDRTIFLATERYSLNFEALQSWWSISNLSLGADKKQRQEVPFLYQGWEGKIMLDGMASTGKQSTLLYGTQVHLAWHQPLFKHITAVVQLQGGYSGGQSKILYNFGGLDNNIVPRVDTSVRFGQGAPYAFQTLITPLRGYEQNSIYGSRFGLLNLDVYFPLFATLIPWRTSFSSVNNLQAGLFTDIAGAQQPKGIPTIKSPLYAYGFSFRTLLAGYPLRFDMAWPGSFDKKPVWYLSLSLL